MSNANSAIDSAIATWNERAAKVGGRDTMLHYRDSRDGSLDLTGAHPSGLAQLLAGRSTRLSSLVRDPEQLTDAHRRIKAIRHKAEQLAYERGIHTAHLAIGFANWSREVSGTRTDFSAPILLRHVTLVPRGTRVEDFEITLADDTTVNPALVDYLHREHKVFIDTDDWVASTQHAHGFDPAGVYDRLRAVTRNVPGLLVGQRLVVSTFANIPTPFSTDDIPRDHPVIRALAGMDRRGRSPQSATSPAAPSSSGGSTAVDRPGTVAGAAVDKNTVPTLGARSDDEPTQTEAATAKPTQKDATEEREATTTSATVLAKHLQDRNPHEEFIAIDVDGDQQAAVDAAVKGESFVLDTPPGTGATQVAVAIATTLNHAGRSVLYVAQSSDALDDFAARLDQAGVRNFVVDGRNRESEMRKQLVSLIVSAEQSRKPELDETVRTLEASRQRLAAHAGALHRVRHPWGTSVFSTMEHLAELTAADPGPVTSVRFGDPVMKLGEAGRRELRKKLLHVSDLGAFTMGVEDTVWFGTRFTTDTDAEQARSTAERAATLVGELVEKAEPVLRESRMNPARNIDEWAEGLAAAVNVRATLNLFSDQVFDANLDDLIAATGSGEYRRAHSVDQGMFERGRLKKAARELVKDQAAVPDLHAALIKVRDHRDAWNELTEAAPRAVKGATEAHDMCAELQVKLATLGEVLKDTPDGGDLGAMLVEELHARLKAMAEDRAALKDLPARTTEEDALRAAGLSELLDDLRDRKVRHAMVGKEFDLAYWATVLQQMAAEDPEIGGHDGDALDKVANQFRAADQEFVAAGAARLAFAHATGWRKAIAAHKAEAESVRTALRAPHLHIRQLADESPRVLSALTPLWMMSPFDVPTHFAAGQFFDTVIIADAARLSVPEALPAIARARHVIALGDPRLPGPRPFSVAVNRHAGPVVPEASSVYTELAEFLPVYGLHMYHRAAPRGLTNVVNDQFYDSAITWVPTARTSEGSGVEFAYVPDATGSPDSVTGQVESPDQEVSRVVDLVLKHARTKARQSLAVITLTPWHAARVASAIQQAIRQYPYVASFFTDTSKEPFVVTDVERVQGFSRDAVIFSVGYGRTLQGRVLYNFGELERDGGHKLIAAIVTRARRKLTVVSSFGPDDLDPTRLKKGALRLLDLLITVAGAGRGRGHLGADARPGAGLGAGTRVGAGAGGGEDDLGDGAPLITDIAERLRKLGTHPVVGYHGIDIALPVGATVDEGMVLAVETDGPGHVPSVRERERLRPEALARRGWTYARLWSTDAFVDPQAAAAKLHGLWKKSVEAHSPQSVLDAARAAAVVTGRRGSRPKVSPGLPLHAYSEADLDAMLEWIQSDEQYRDDAELTRQLERALAYRGHADLNDTIGRAIRRYRAAQARAQAAFEGAEAEAGAGSGGLAGGAGGVVSQEDVMPTYDTGVLRDQELIDAGLRDDEKPE